MKNKNKLFKQEAFVNSLGIESAHLNNLLFLFQVFLSTFLWRLYVERTNADCYLFEWSGNYPKYLFNSWSVDKTKPQFSLQLPRKKPHNRKLVDHSRWHNIGFLSNMLFFFFLQEYYNTSVDWVFCSKARYFHSKSN